MNFKQITSKLPPSVIERAIQLYYKFLYQRIIIISEADFIKEMDEFITYIEEGINYG